MSAPTYIRLLYLGRQNALPQAIDDLWRNAHSTKPTDPPLFIRTMRVTSQARAMETLRAQSCQGIVLEINNSRQNRSRFCQGLRRRFPELRILALCQEPIHTKIFTFDGELRWPLVMPETERVLRATFDPLNQTYLRMGPIQLDVATRTLLGPRGRHRLPPKQADLLRLLIDHAGEVVNRETIMRIVWDTEFLADTRTIDVHIRWLREKIEPNPAHPIHLITARGQGYQLVVR